MSSSIVGGRDATSEVVSNEDGVVAGIRESRAVFDELGVETSAEFDDGDRIDEGDVVLVADGDAESVLRAERLALNILGSMSGVATATRGCAERAGDVTVAATRKTTPGYRVFEKRAVRLGGGDPHRHDLTHAVMVKDNHIALLGLDEAVERAREGASFTTKIEVEAESVETAVRAADLGADIVLLDNMEPAEVERGVDALADHDVLVEASGGITPGNVADYAATGVDVVSMGSLIHSSDWLDFSMSV